MPPTTAPKLASCLSASRPTPWRAEIQACLRDGGGGKLSLLVLEENKTRPASSYSSVQSRHSSLWPLRSLVGGESRGCLPVLQTPPPILPSACRGDAAWNQTNLPSPGASIALTAVRQDLLTRNPAVLWPLDGLWEERNPLKLFNTLYRGLFPQRRFSIFSRVSNGQCEFGCM